jgi:hypothetical protein
MSISTQLTSEQLKEIIEEERTQTMVQGRFWSKWRMVRRYLIQIIPAQY